MCDMFSYSMGWGEIVEELDYANSMGAQANS